MARYFQMGNRNRKPTQFLLKLHRKNGIDVHIVIFSNFSPINLFDGVRQVNYLQCSSVPKARRTHHRHFRSITFRILTHYFLLTIVFFFLLRIFALAFFHHYYLSPYRAKYSHKKDNFLRPLKEANRFAARSNMKQGTKIVAIIFAGVTDVSSSSNLQIGGNSSFCRR